MQPEEKKKVWFMVIVGSIVGVGFCVIGLILSFGIWEAIKALPSLGEKGGLIVLCILPGIVFSFIGLCFFNISKSLILKVNRINHKEELETIKNNCTTLEGELSSVMAKLNAIDENLNTAKTNYEKTTAELTTSQELLSTTQTNLNATTQRIDALNSACQNSMLEINSIKTDIALVKKRQQQNEVVINNQTLELIDKINNKDTRDQLLEEFAKSQLGITQGIKKSDETK